eukprot:3205046-Prymnesium_polylepis.1
MSLTSTTARGTGASSDGKSWSMVRPPGMKCAGASRCVPEPRLNVMACLLRASGALVISGVLRTCRTSGLHVG